MNWFIKWVRVTQVSGLSLTSSPGSASIQQPDIGDDGWRRGGRGWWSVFKSFLYTRAFNMFGHLSWRDPVFTYLRYITNVHVSVWAFTFTERTWCLLVIYCTSSKLPMLNLISALPIKNCIWTLYLLIWCKGCLSLKGGFKGEREGGFQSYTFAVQKVADH